VLPAMSRKRGCRQVIPKMLVGVQQGINPVLKMVGEVGFEPTEFSFTRKRFTVMRVSNREAIPKN